jgi:hypothetical protein
MSVLHTVLAEKGFAPGDQQGIEPFQVGGDLIDLGHGQFRLSRIRNAIDLRGIETGPATQVAAPGHKKNKVLESCHF